MQHAQDSKTSIEMSLREHLLAAGAGQPSGPVTPVHQAHNPVGGHHEQHHNIDPAISGGYGGMSPDSGDGHLSEGRKGRRELSTSKRAAQNRAAQRAFRQRKEEYIKSLKDQVKEYESLAETYKAVQQENYQLRDYIINLQSRLLESQGSIPPPPENIDLTRPHPALAQAQVAQSEPSNAAPQAPQGAPTATMTPVAINQLQQAAAQASAHDVNNDGKPSNGYFPASTYTQDQNNNN